jgi:hypothetical protein
VTTLPVTPAQFRIDLPAFADPGTYPDGTVGLYLTAAQAALNLPRFGAFAIIAVECMAAHYLTLGRADERAAATGGEAGVNAGMVASKGVGPVNIGREVSSSVEQDGGHWNLTTFGRRYLRMAREAGAGPIQLGGVPFPGGAGGNWFPGSASAYMGWTGGA